MDAISQLWSLIRQLQGALGGARVVQGRVLGTGVIETQTGGATVVRNGAGDYTITFDPPFSQIPSVQLTVGNIAAVVFAKESPFNSGSTSSFRAAMFNASGTLVDSQFQFTAVG